MQDENLMAEAVGKMVQQRDRDNDFTTGVEWLWQEDCEILRVDVGLIVSGNDMRELVDTLTAELDGASCDVGVLVNATVTSLSVERMSGLLRRLRQHKRTKAVAFLTPFYDKFFEDMGLNQLGFFCCEDDALTWLRKSLVD